jgi:DNA-binding CsgD family transcriptional regulator
MTYLQSGLTGSIYEMALGRAGWDGILDMLAAAFPGCLVLVSGDDVAARQNLVFSQRGLKPQAVSAYVAGFAARNPWLDGQAGQPVGHVFHDDQLLARDVAKQSEFYTQWLARQGEFDAGTGVVVLRRGTRQLTIEIRYAASDSETREKAAAILGDAANHLARAFEIAARTQMSSRPGYLDGVVEDLPFAVFLVGEDMRIDYANFHAEALRRQNATPFVASDGFLHAADAEADAALRQLVQKALASRHAPTTVLPIRAAGDARYFAVARPTGRGAQPYQLHDAILGGGPLVMLAIHGNLDASTLPLDLLWRAFSLTESEALLAEALLNGATVADYAMEREVSKQTLRNQLVGVMRKTGTRRQSELVSLLTRLALTCL